MELPCPEAGQGLPYDSSPQKTRQLSVKSLTCAGDASCRSFTCLNTQSLAAPFRYSYEEFMDHVRAMKTVQEWEHTLRFGHLGRDQTSRANSARVLEYFADTYHDRKEALHKAELFLSIYDYIGRNANCFGRKGLAEDLGNGLFSVDPALLRSVHFAFTLPQRPEKISPKSILNLARAFKELEPAL